jgi:hypothetical protein
LMWKFTKGLPGSKYLGTNKFPSTRSASCLITFIVGASFFLLHRLLIHSSLINLLKMGTSLMGCKRGIFTHKLLSSPRSYFSSDV